MREKEREGEKRGDYNNAVTGYAAAFASPKTNFPTWPINECINLSNYIKLLA